MDFAGTTSRAYVSAGFTFRVGIVSHCQYCSVSGIVSTAGRVSGTLSVLICQWYVGIVSSLLSAPSVALILVVSALLCLSVVHQLVPAVTVGSPVHWYSQYCPVSDTLV